MNKIILKRFTFLLLLMMTTSIISGPGPREDDTEESRKYFFESTPLSCCEAFEVLPLLSFSPPYCGAHELPPLLSRPPSLKSIAVKAVKKFAHDEIITLDSIQEKRLEEIDHEIQRVQRIKRAIIKNATRMLLGH